MGVSPWMNAQGGPSEARRAKEGASADCAEEMKDTTGVSPWRLYYPFQRFLRWAGKLLGLQTWGADLKRTILSNLVGQNGSCIKKPEGKRSNG